MQLVLENSAEKNIRRIVRTQKNKNTKNQKHNRKQKELRPTMSDTE